jgi:hypothetical protein
MTLPADLSPVERQHLRAQAEEMAGFNYCCYGRGCVDCEREHVELIESALLAQRLQGRTEGEPAWRPIESAPKDEWGGVLVVVDGNVGEAQYHGEEGWYWVNNHPTDSWGGRIYPTRWMPLPASPSVSPTAQKDQDTHTRGVGE